MCVWFEIYIAVITRANKEEASLWFEINYPGGEEAEPSPINQGNLVSWVKPPTEAKLSFIAVVGGYVESKREAELIAMQWAVRDMVNIRQQRIVFESSCVLARDTFLYLPSHVEHTPRDIVGSVTAEHRYHSYIACGGPSWMLRRIESEAGA
ncbi:hypothetical protein Bca4012_037190 [Brassica carinata]